MRCKNITIIDTIICAKACTYKFNESPVAKFSFENYVLSDDSTYFDGDLSSLRQINWKVYVDEYLVYDFGWNFIHDIVIPLGNGSTYGQLNLGILNQDILSMLEALPSTIIAEGTVLDIFLDVKDDSGIMNQNISNKYKFIK